MAQQIIQIHRLPTIRIRFVPSRHNAQVQFDTFHGSEHLAQSKIDAEAIGIHSELSVRAYRYANFSLPADFCSDIRNSLQEVTSLDEPLWLQVGSSAGHLAVVPWERLLQEQLHAPLLRVPNFLTPPVLSHGPLRIVLCASSPRAKTPFNLADYVRDFVAVLSDSLYHGGELHLFADLASYQELQSLARTGSFSVIVHDPHRAEQYGVGDSDKRLGDSGDRLKSPWLRWILSSLDGAAVSAVHFVCPGYFSRDQGAMALARSPGDNYDSQWSHFVGADELMAFLNQVGAWYVGFSPPYDNVWAIGLRLLADRLAWQRPGALLLHDTEGGSPLDLIDAFRFLFSDTGQPPPASPNLMLYSHPARLPRYRDEEQGFESVEAFGLGDSTEASPRLQDLVLKMSSPQQYETGNQIAWRQSGLRLMDQLLLQAERQDEATRRGTVDALSKMASIFEGES